MPRNKKTSKLPITVRVMPDGDLITLSGQRAQAIRLLLERSGNGVTSLEAWFDAGIARLAARISEMRPLLIDIQTTRERTPSGATIGRYRLLSKLQVTEGGKDVER